MNKEFVKKMIKAKALEYEAFKELFNEYVPQPVADRINKRADEVKGILKEAVFEIIKDSGSFSSEETEPEEKEEGNKKNKKIKVDFQ